ncbi:MAG: glycosyltransferase [Ignavibacteriales bacterium]|nr:MAG: glycosyltransferase [Ignavibacteriales bacterium]
MAGVLRGLKKLKPATETKIPDDFISIIIPFRNEAENIVANLKSIETQNYPLEKFEVIYVDDFSTDESAKILLEAIKQSNIKVISVPEDFSKHAHKKRAIRFGIQNSKGEIIVTTDADCFHNPDWLKSLVSSFDAQTGFISGPVEFYDSETLFGKMQKLEFAGLVLVGAGLIGIKRPTICNAANLAYRKKAYDEVNGFADQMNLSSGDDELLMQKISKETKYEVKFCLNKNAIVKTDPNSSLRKFYNQRKRWSSKGLFYADKFLVLKLIGFYLYFIGMIVQFVLGLFNPVYFISFSISIFLKLILEFLILKKGAVILFNKKILQPFIAAEIFHIPYIVIAGIAGAFGNFTWKDRKVKR